MRYYIPENFKVTTWHEIENYFKELNDRYIADIPELINWMKDRSELESAISEDMAWRYIKMTCDTTNEELTKSFQDFVQNISKLLKNLG